MVLLYDATDVQGLYANSNNVGIHYILLVFYVLGRDVARKTYNSKNQPDLPIFHVTSDAHKPTLMVYHSRVVYSPMVNENYVILAQEYNHVDL